MFKSFEETAAGTYTLTGPVPTAGWLVFNDGTANLSLLLVDNDEEPIVLRPGEMLKLAVPSASMEVTCTGAFRAIACGSATMFRNFERSRLVASGGGGESTTYAADGSTLQLVSDTFSVKSGGIGSTQLGTSAVSTIKVADEAVTAAKLAAAVAGSGLSGGAGTALALNVDNSTVEVNADFLRVKPLGIRSAELGNGSVVSNKIDNQAVTYIKMGAGTERVPLCSGAVSLDVAGKPLPLDTITISVTDSVGTVGNTFIADGAGPFDFAIGATAADTLTNLIVAALAFFATSRSQLRMLPNAAGDFALLSVAQAQPASAINLGVTIPSMTLTNYTKTNQVALVMSQSRLRSSYVIPYLVAAADVGRGYFAIRADTLDAFSATPVVPWLIGRTTAGVMKTLGCAVTYDSTLNAWVVTNTGTDDFANLDEILILNILDT